MKVGLCIPVYNGGERWAESLAVLTDIAPLFTRMLVVDSGSADDSLRLAQEAGFETVQITPQDFNHGATRQWMFKHIKPDIDVIVFATQDAILANPNGVNVLLSSFDNERVGAAFARQLPHRDAGPFGAHARRFNYPNTSRVSSLDDAKRIGIKAAFISNSFAAYRTEALQAVGGFPDNVILGEDTYVAAKMLLDGWHIAYCAEAEVYHSHDYTMFEEFRRYFDTGVFHSRESWLLTSFGTPEGEGGRFVKSEMRYLSQNYPWLIPLAIIRTLMKYVGYRLGRMEQSLPLFLKRYLSMHKRYWVSEKRPTL